MIHNRPFGKTGLKLPELGLGAWALGGNAYGTVLEEEAFQILELGLDQGMLFVDTADIYGFGESESRIGRFLSEKNARKKIFLATKGGLAFREGPVRKEFSRSYLEKALEASLKRLGVECVDLYQLHGPRPSEFENGECLEFLEEAKKEGKIRSAGVSLHDPEEARVWLGSTAVDSVQLPYSMIDRRLEALLPLIHKTRKALIVREIFASGFLSGRYSPESVFPKDDHRRQLSSDQKQELSKRIAALQKENAWENGQLIEEALRFSLKPQEVSITLMGVSKRGQLEENLAHYDKIVAASSSPRKRGSSLDSRFHGNDMKGLSGGSNWGINKEAEAHRLAYEISRREMCEASQVLEDAGRFAKKKSKENMEPSFKDVKAYLIQRRYPNLSLSERSKVLLTRLPLVPLVTVTRGDSHQGNQDYQPTKIYIEKNADDLPFTKRILERFPHVPQERIGSLKALRRPQTEWREGFGKDVLCLTAEERDFLKRCPCSKGSVGCNYYILNLGFGCPYDCSYCYLQFYQNTPANILYANPERYLDQIAGLIKNKKDAWLRIGTGEFTDSLALDHLTEYSKVLVPFFKDKPFYLELKTKSDRIQNLITLDHGGRTVVAWSLNPECFSAEEKGTAPVNDRIRSARKVQEAGYPAAFHFDPIIYGEGWEAAYRELIEHLYDTILKSPQWVSLGLFRYHRNLKRVAEERHPETRIFLGEQIPEGASGKYQYPERFRVTVYRRMVEWIRKRDPKVPIYLCMESSKVWKAVFEEMPYRGRIDQWIVSQQIADSTCLPAGRDSR